MEQLLGLLCVFLVVAVRLLHRVIYHSHLGLNRRRETSPEATTGSKLEPDVDEGVHEGSNLLDTVYSRHPGASEPIVQTRTRKVVCSAAAAGYMVITALIVKRSFEESDGAILLLKDPRFVYGRVGMFVMAMIAMLRAIAGSSTTKFEEIQADGLTLFVLPFILRLIKTPGASEKNSTLELVLEPMLGIVYFLTGVRFK
ncbi:hypothetical protein C8R44DRAFT_851791 [Mycena epipterygia]|nr:hypothetical protein C8R44DRAFT_851791 [Mycena epipterygia]